MFIQFIGLETFYHTIHLLQLRRNSRNKNRQKYRRNVRQNTNSSVSIIKFVRRKYIYFFLNERVNYTKYNDSVN